MLNIKTCSLSFTPAKPFHSCYQCFSPKVACCLHRPRLCVCTITCNLCRCLDHEQRVSRDGFLYIKVLSCFLASKESLQQFVKSNKIRKHKEKHCTQLSTWNKWHNKSASFLKKQNNNQENKFLPPPPPPQLPTMFKDLPLVINQASSVRCVRHQLTLLMLTRSPNPFN